MKNQRPDPSQSSRLEAALDRCSRLLARRRAMAGASLGAWVGLLLAALWLAAWLLRLLPLPGLSLLLIPLGLGLLIGGLLGLRREGLTEPARALLLDRILGSDEAAITALGIDGAGDPMVERLLHDLERLLEGAGPLITERLRVRPPRHLRLLPLALIGLLLASTLPQRAAPSRSGPPTNLSEEAEALAARKQELERELKVHLPSELDEAIEQLLSDAREGKLAEGGARAAAEDLREQLDALAKGQGLSAAARSQKAAAEAIEQVDPEAGRDLQDALRSGEREASKDALRQLQRRLGLQGEAAQRGAARALEQAARGAEQAGESGLAEALRQEADALRDTAATKGADGSPPPGGLEQYLDQLAQRGATQDSLAEQQRQMDLAQRLNGAMSHLGERGGQPGQGQASGERGAEPGDPWGAGSDHTDGDDPAYETAGRGHQDRDRQVDGRRPSWSTDFGQEHAPSRLEGIEALAVTAQIPLSKGPIESQDIRLTGSDEQAQAPLLDVPASYRRAAEQAIDGEQVPRAYREQVKSYFDVAR